MPIVENKSANRLYKEYKIAGGTLSFKQWMDREKRKSFLNTDGSVLIPVNKPLNDSIQNVLDEMHRTSGYKSELENKYIFGISKQALIISGLSVTLLLIGYVAYHKFKQQ